jgi:hypothetical protein
MGIGIIAFIKPRRKSIEFLIKLIAGKEIIVLIFR